VQRGIAVAGVNAYEDSDLFLAPPPPLPDSDADLAADMLAADGESGSNATDAAPAAAAAAPAPQVSRDTLKRCTWCGVPAGPLGPLHLPQRTDVATGDVAELAAAARPAARRTAG
jgi:hypothetical protein